MIGDIPTHGQQWIKAIDVSEHRDPGDFPLCPLCDNEIHESEDVALAVSYGSLAAVHAWCLSDLLKQ